MTTKRGTHDAAPGAPGAKSFEELLRMIVREEVRAALVESMAAARAEQPANANEREYLTSEEVSDLIGVSSETLKKWRCLAEGPAFIKVARRSIRYRATDVRAWLAQQTRGKRGSR